MVVLFSKYAEKLIVALETIEQTNIDLLKKEFLERLNGKSQIFFIGNGGSASNAQHIVGDYQKTFALLGTSLKLSCPIENISYLTAASNDLDFSQVYQLLIGRTINKKDLIVYLSGSGNSVNLVKAAMEAKKVGIKQVAVTAYNGGRLKEIVDIPIHINYNDMEIAEDCQLSIFHYIKQFLYNECIKNDDTINERIAKYNKRTIEDVVA